MLISIFLLMLLGAGVGVVVAIAYAISRNRVGLAALIGGLAVLAVLFLAMTGFLFLGYQQHDVKITTPAPAWVDDHVPQAVQAVQQQLPAVDPLNSQPMQQAAQSVTQQMQQFHVSASNTHVNLGGARLSVTWSVILVIVLLMFVIRRLARPAAACGGHRAWLWLLIFPVLALLLCLGLFRARSSSSYNAASEQARQVAEAERVRHQFEEARRNAEQQIRSPQVVPPPDIHEQMDNFDGPKIPLSSQQKPSKIPAPPSAATPSAATPYATSPNITNGPVASGPKGKPTSASGKSSAKAKNSTLVKAPGSSGHKRKATDAAVAAAKSTNEPTDVTKPYVAEVLHQFVDALAAAAAANQKATAAAEVEPVAPANARPKWVNEPPRRVGNIPREVVTTEEYQTAEECKGAANVYLLLKTYQHLQHLLGIPYVDNTLPSLSFIRGEVMADGIVISSAQVPGLWFDYRLRELGDLGIRTDDVWKAIVAKDPKTNESREYLETVQRSVGEMQKLHVQIEFTPAFDTELRRRWDARERQRHLAQAGVGAGFVIALLGLAFGLLKIDTWTKGYYTKRLFIGVPAAIIAGMFLLSTFIVRHGKLF